MSKNILLHVRDAAEEAEVRKYLKFSPENTRVVYRTKVVEEPDANGVVRSITSTNPDADEAIRQAGRDGTAVYTTGVFLDNAEGIGNVNYINMWSLKNKSKTKPGTVHCFLANVKDSEALEALKGMVEFQKAFGIGLTEEEAAEQPF